MSTDPKEVRPSGPMPGNEPRQRGIRIFTYPKIIFLVPTLIAALVSGIGMALIHDETRDPRETTPSTKTTIEVETKQGAEKPVVTQTTGVRRFSSTQNILGLVFLTVFGLNLLVMSIDFPRFTVIALVLLVAALGFFILWLNVYFELLPPLVRALESVYTVANAGFYFVLATIILASFGIILLTRYLDYWEVLPNEILHNHGPFSDLERYPTFNLKFDKEIPDILEYALLRSGRLVLHIPGQAKAIVLDNVLWINHKEEELKKLMSRMEVRVTSDQEATTRTINP